MSSNAHICRQLCPDVRSLLHDWTGNIEDNQHHAGNMLRIDCVACASPRAGT